MTLTVIVNQQNHQNRSTSYVAPETVVAQLSMMEAIRSNDAGLFELAYVNGANPFLHGDKRFTEALTPFHNAAMKGFTSIVRVVLKNEPDKVDMREPKFQKTALHFAATHGHVDLVQLLLKYSADPMPMAADLWTPLHYSAENGHEEVIRALLDHGADPNAPNDRKQTPLHLAAVFNNGNALKVFVTHYGSRVLGSVDQTAHAIKTSSPIIPELARIIAELATTPCNLDLKDEWDKTAYDWADECMDWKEGADPRAVDMFYLASDDYLQEKSSPTSAPSR